MATTILGSAAAPAAWSKPVPPAMPLAARVALARLAVTADQSSALIDNAGIADSLLAKLSMAGGGDLTAFANNVAAQRGKHIAASAADSLLAIAAGATPAQTMTPGAAAVVPALVASDPVVVSVPPGTAVATLTVTAPVVAEAVSPPGARTALGTVIVKAYDNVGAPLTSFSAAPLTVSVGFAAFPGVDPARAEIDTLDPVSHMTQRLATTVTKNVDGTFTASALTPHLSPFVVTVPAPAGTTATVLGGPTEGPATQLPQGSEATAVDSNGVVYTSDGNVIRAIDPSSGHESVVVGSGGYPPDSDTLVPEPGVNANPFEVYGLAVDHANRLLVVDWYHQVIRRLDANGVLSTVAGGGSPPDGVGDGLPANDAALNGPRAIAVDGADNLFILTDGSVRRVDASTGIVTTAAGTFALGYPTAITADTTGNLYENAWDASAGVETLWMITPGGTPTQIWQGSDITSMAVTPTGDLVATTSGTAEVLEFAVTAPLQSSPSTPAFAAPVAIAGNGSWEWAGDDPQPAAGAPLNGPLQISASRDGSLYFAEFGTRVRSITPDGTLVTYAGTDADPPTPTVLPSAVAIGADGTTYVADRNALYRVDASGTPTQVPVPGLHTDWDEMRWKWDGGTGQPILASNIVSLAIDSANRVLIADRGQGLLLRFDPATALTTTLPGPDEYVLSQQQSRAGGPGSNVYRFLKSLTVNNAGQIFVVDGDVLAQVNSSTVTRRAVDVGDSVTSVAADAAGTIHFATGNRLFRLNLVNGDSTAEWAGAGVTGLTADPAGGIFVSADSRIHRLTFDANHNVVNDTVVGGTGTAGYNGDGLPGPQTQFQTLTSMAVDGTGDLLVADTGNVRLRELVAPFSSSSSVASKAA